MHRASWRTRESLRMFFIGLATVIVFISGKLWPRYESAIWAVFLIAVAFYMCIRLRQPVNYKSIVISEETIEYVGLGSRDVIRLDAIAKLEFVREEAVFPDLHGPYLEPKWVIQTASGAHVEIMDEWPHRSSCYVRLESTCQASMPPRPRRDLKRGGKAGGSAPGRPLTSAGSRRGVRYRILDQVAPSRSRREPRRRWFSDDDFDLVVWFSDSGSIAGFELCYDKSHAERALIWSSSGGYGHFRVDTGERTPLKNLTPILVADGALAKDRVIAGFLEVSRNLDPAIRSFVIARLQEYPSGRD